MHRHHTVFRELAAPYVWTDFPSPEDSPAYVVVVRPSTSLFDAPRASSKVVATLSDEVAEAVVFLLSEASTYTTGAVLRVAGGR